MVELSKDKQLILFDGVCNLCNSSVQFVIKKDKANRFVFAPLQSETGQFFINKFNIDTDKVDSIILIPDNDTYYSKSTAALRVAKHLGFPTSWLFPLLIFPAFMRNWVYDYIARNRYKWYGKKEACMIPTPKLKAKFLD